MSSPDAIEKLFYLNDDNKFKLWCYHGSSFFHPKLFLFRTKSSWSIILGSSNLSEGGMKDNIEFNCYIFDLNTHDPIVTTLKTGIQAILHDSSTINRPWIDQFRKKCKSLKRSQRAFMKKAESAEAELKRQQHVEMDRWHALIKTAIQFKKSIYYRQRFRETPKFILKCHRAIGSATNPQVNVKMWRDKDVGYFSTLDSRNYSKTVPNTVQKQKRLNSTLKHLLDVGIPLEDRIATVARSDGSHHIEGMGISHVSEILNKYFPAECIVLNKPIVEALHHYGIRHFSSDPMQRYIAALSVYRKLRDEAKYPVKYGFALLDSFMWRKGHKLIYGWA